MGEESFADANPNGGANERSHQPRTGTIIPRCSIICRQGVYRGRHHRLRCQLDRHLHGQNRGSVNGAHARQHQEFGWPDRRPSVLAPRGRTTQIAPPIRHPISRPKRRRNCSTTCEQSPRAGIHSWRSCRPSWKNPRRPNDMAWRRSRLTASFTPAAAPSGRADGIAAPPPVFMSRWALETTNAAEATPAPARPLRRLRRRPHHACGNPAARPPLRAGPPGRSVFSLPALRPDPHRRHVTGPASRPRPPALPPSIKFHRRE